MSPLPATTFQHALLTWYNASHRPMPWRNTTEPYPIWLAEVMLQQTTVAAVIPYHQRFLHHFPTVHALAAAPLESVLHLWQGLGYYRRAHLLHACAKAVSAAGGTFPTTLEGLLALPGLGPYTAHVLMATAYNQPAVVVDGNVERVITRLHRIQQSLPAAKPTIKQHAAHLCAGAPPRLYANAIMELGATVCTPKNPQCEACPAQQFCQAYQHHDQPTYPRKSAKKKNPHHHATATLITTPGGQHLYLQQRLATGMLAGLWELPHTGTPNLPSHTPKLKLSPAKPLGSITHTFSHFKLTLEIHHATTPKIPNPNTFTWDNLPPLSTLMKKALSQGLKHLG